MPSRPGCARHFAGHLDLQRLFWPITLMVTGSKRPIASALANPQGQFVSNQNLIAAAAVMARSPR